MISEEDSKYMKGSLGRGIYELLKRIQKDGLTVDLEASDIQIGAVEIKDGITDSRAEVTFDGQVRNLEYIEGNDKTYEDTDFIVGESPRVLDVNTDLGRNAHDGYIICDGAGDLLVEISNDGAVYGGQGTMKTGEVFKLGGRNVDSIRLTHSGTDSKYRIRVV